MALLTQVAYLYRDASNYKFRGTFRLLGELNADKLRDDLFDSEFFVPEKIGLPPLRPAEVNEDDHLLHSIEECAVVEGSSFEMTAGEFRRRIRNASQEGWFS